MTEKNAKPNGSEREDPTAAPAQGQAKPEAAAGGAPGAKDQPAGAAPTSAPAELPAAYEKLLKEKHELYDRLLRKQAELENYRKRVEREKAEFVEHATADLVRALLPVLDGFERALKHRDASVPESFLKGVEIICSQFRDVLSRAGVTPVATEGKTFDPHVHQAIETVVVEGRRDHEIVEELQRGYKLKNRLLRPAIVKVAVSKKDKEAEAAPEPCE